MTYGSILSAPSKYLIILELQKVVIALRANNAQANTSVTHA